MAQASLTWRKVSPPHGTAGGRGASEGLTGLRDTRAPAARAPNLAPGRSPFAPAALPAAVLGAGFRGPPVREPPRDGSGGGTKPARTQACLSPAHKETPFASRL